MGVMQNKRNREREAQYKQRDELIRRENETRKAWEEDKQREGTGKEMEKEGEKEEEEEERGRREDSRENRRNTTNAVNVFRKEKKRYENDFRYN